MREMKDSGIEWVGKVPKIWSLKPIRALFDEVTEKNFLGTCSNALKFTYGSIVRKPNFDADADDYVASTILNYTVVEPGTIMLNGLNLNFDFVSQRIGLVKEKGVITSAYMAFKSNEKHLIDSEFATYLFKAYDGCKAFHNMGGGVRKILNFNEFKKYYIPLPDLNEQHHIVDYLDTKCSEIDATAEDIQKEIALLEEYKKSVITEAVTKGLNPDAEMKDSGIEWLGKVPTNWNFSRVLYNIKFEGGSQPPLTEFVGDYREGYIRLIQNRDYKTDAYKVYVPKKSVSKFCDEEDIMVGRYGPPLFVIHKGLKGAYNVALMKAVPIGINKQFMYYFLHNSTMLNYIESFSKRTAGQSGVNPEILKKYPMFLPNFSEQQQIADYLDTQCSEIDTLIADKKRQLDILADYKKSLIYEYVTGKKEVPVKDF